MLNRSMRVKQVLISVFLILILVVFNKVFLNSYNKANNYFLNQSLYNTEKISSQKLFDKTWKIIYKEYSDNGIIMDISIPQNIYFYFQDYII